MNIWHFFQWLESLFHIYKQTSILVTLYFILFYDFYHYDTISLLCCEFWQSTLNKYCILLVDPTTKYFGHKSAKTYSWKLRSACATGIPRFTGIALRFVLIIRVRFQCRLGFSLLWDVFDSGSEYENFSLHSRTAVFWLVNNYIRKAVKFKKLKIINQSSSWQNIADQLIDWN